jgi:uncharacterized metal-binding protein
MTDKELFMRTLGWIFVPFVMIFKNWRQRAFWANVIGSLYALCMLSFYTLVVFVSLTGGAFLADLPLDFRGAGGCRDKKLSNYEKSKMGCYDK